MSGAPEVPATPRWFDIAAKVIFWIAVLLVLNTLFVKLAPLFAPNAPANALRVDFAVLWAAGKLAFIGQPLAAFDQQTLLAAASLAPGVQPGNLLWLYPASFQIFLMPFGALPFAAAFPAFVAASAKASKSALSWSASVRKSRLPMTTPSKLLKSCAMPPVNCPTASIFCAWRSWFSSLRWSVMSMLIDPSDSSVPPSSKTGNFSTR